MKVSSFGVQVTVLASLIVSGKAYAQSLPDEINHPQYLKIYEGLEKILAQRTAEFNKLNDKKIELEKTIKEMEKDQLQLPVRNEELKKIIETKRKELEGVNNEIQGLEGVLAKVSEDLQRLNNVISQLERDLSAQSEISRQIQTRRSQMLQELARLNTRLQNVVNEENRALQDLNRINSELNGAEKRRQELEVERVQLGRDVERYKVDVVQSKNALNQNTTLLNVKKPLLGDVQAKLAGLRTEISAEEAKLAQIDVILNPKKTQLENFKAELARLAPDIVKLQNENKGMEQKIQANVVKLSQMNIDALNVRKANLETELVELRNQIQININTMKVLFDRIAPIDAQIETLRKQRAEAAAQRNFPEVKRLTAEIDRLNAEIDPSRTELKNLTQANQKLNASVNSKQSDLNEVNASIAALPAQIAALQSEIQTLKLKIDDNNRKIDQLNQANSTLSQKISALEAELVNLEAQRNPSVKRLATLKDQEKLYSDQITVLSSEVQGLEKEIQRLNVLIAEMEKAINDFPQNLRRLEANIRVLIEKAQDLRSQADYARRAVARIQQDRINAQSDRDRAQDVVDSIASELADSERRVATIRGLVTEESRKRDALLKYNQENLRKLEALKISRADAEKDIAGASQEITVNEQDLATINTQLPKLKTDFSIITPQVAAAEAARNTAQTNATNANANYQNRLSLYQKYLTEAQALGAERAKIGSSDGVKAGAVDARATGTKLGAESAGSEAKWEAIRRGYVRGEIAGFKNGFDIGIASPQDIERGETEGLAAGVRRAKDYANMVIKPEKYAQELERRIREDETSSRRNQFLGAIVSQQLTTTQAMMRELQATIPDLSPDEIQDAEKIISSLDAMIAQSDVELVEVLNLRKKISKPANVYSVPGQGENADKVDCSAVYKGVKDFVEACKGTYVVRYQNLYARSHSESFSKEYGPVFSAQIERVFDAELTRLFPLYLKEATTIGREVGIATGKKEIYQQTFSKAENLAYSATLPGENKRVESEAAVLVQEHLNQNAVLALKAPAKLVTSSSYGLSPGVDAELRMLLKNIGALPSQANSFVRITELSGNITPERREAPIGSIEARTHADLSVLKLNVNDNALPGSKAIIAGEIVHPGNHYRSNRIEAFRIESPLMVNPSIDTKVLMDMTPKVSGIFGLKKHEIDFSIKPKFSGVDKGYEVTVEEIGTQFMEVVSRPAVTELLGRNVEKKVQFVYRLSKPARGQSVNLKLSVKNDGRIVYVNTVQIRPE